MERAPIGKQEFGAGFNPETVAAKTADLTKGQNGGVRCQEQSLRPGWDDNLTEVPGRVRGDFKDTSFHSIWPFHPSDL